MCRLPRRADCALALTLVVAGFTSIPTPLAAQRLGPEQDRPKLEAGADTNDAAAYLAHGARELEYAPDEAAAAFYWAARLDPSSADAFYGRRIALLMRKPSTLKSYMSGNRKARASKEFKMIDSLQLRALRLNPLFYRRFDRTMIMAYYRNLLRMDAGSMSPGEVDQYIMQELDRRPASTRAWLAYSNGRMDQALILYSDAINRSKKSPLLRMDRARVYATQGQVAPAIDDFKAALGLLQAQDDEEDEDVIFYDSKALVEHSIGLLWQLKGNPDSARAAYGRATIEDLSYFPAHVALGILSLAQGDSATAAVELALAAGLATDDPYVHHLHGSVLVAMLQFAEAMEPLRKAIDLEPYFAAPHFSLAQALERSDDLAGARAEYERFVALASRRDPMRPTAMQRVAALAGK